MVWQDRTIRLLGEDSVAKLNAARVCVFGLGAVGSYAVEAMARAGIGNFLLVDFDTVKESNINRQLYALHSTLGQNKVELTRARILDINPEAVVDARGIFAHADTLPQLLRDKPDLIIDAVDSLTPKTEIIAAGAERSIPVFSAMGAATRIDADKIHFARLFDAKGCPLARLVRKRLRRRAVDESGDLWCVYSDELRNVAAIENPDEHDRQVEEGEYDRGRVRGILGSLSTITGIFGLRLAHEAILRLAGSIATLEYTEGTEQ